MTSVGATPEQPGPAGSGPDRLDLEDQRERTLLSWRRTGQSLAAAGILAGHFATWALGSVPVALAFVALAISIGYCWLAPRIRVAQAGVAVVCGVLVLGILALATILDP